jgi:hypothetical protein
MASSAKRRGTAPDSTAHDWHDRVDAEIGAGTATGGLPDCGAARRIRQDRQAASGHRVHVVRLAQESRDAVVDELREAADPRGDDRHFAGHRFERRHAEALLGRREQKEVGGRKPGHQIELLADELDRVAEAFRSGTVFEGRPIRAVANQHELRGDFAADPCEDVQHLADPLHRPEVRDVQYQGFAAARAPALPDGRVRLALVELAVQKVRDDADVAADTQ